MTSISRSALVPYAPAEMYVLVNDIKSYPQFLPWCCEAEIQHQDEDEIQASVTLAKRGVRTTFSTRNRLQKNKMVEMTLVEGPFRHLHGFWRFEQLEGDQRACRVRLDLDFELANRIMAMTLGPLFNQVANALVDAFVKRAHDVYDRTP